MSCPSGTPLVKKLGIKEDQCVAFLDAPADFARTLGEIPPGVFPEAELGDGDAFDVILFFTHSEAELRQRFAALARRLTPAGGLWIAWPKRTSGVETDLNDNVVRGIGLQAGLVDNKICSIDTTWSGQRFVIRVQDRRRVGKAR
jgi:hypothetical protein